VNAIEIGSGELVMRLDGAAMPRLLRQRNLGFRPLLVI